MANKDKTQKDSGLDVGKFVPGQNQEEEIEVVEPEFSVVVENGTKFLMAKVPLLKPFPSKEGKVMMAAKGGYTDTDIAINGYQARVSVNVYLKGMKVPGKK